VAPTVVLDADQPRLVSCPEVNVTEPEVPVSTEVAPFFVVIAPVLAPAVLVLVSPLIEIETAVPVATVAAVNE
jgi:hypothetical protein